MKTSTLTIRLAMASVVVAAGLCCGALAADDSAQAQFWQTPAIEGAGRMHPLPRAAYQPSPRETYKVVFAVAARASKPTDVNPGLERVARTVNLYASAGVPLDHLKFVAVLYGPATDAALDDAHYRQSFGTSNPNLDVIGKLRHAGVDVAICGQALAEHHYQYDWVAPQLTLALSALTTITVLEHRGYTLVPLL
ncbi:MAG TPA: DsrE family protein [Steroidobacteraceae bacterium]|nr:DsrE family protein [Steroidobacteraceae bacterium]